MKFILSTIATAALAMVVSSAAIETAQDNIAHALPARFAMYLETAESAVNGLRIQYIGGSIVINRNQARPAKDGVFLGGNGRISVDLTVHTNPSGQTPPGPNSGGAWNLMFIDGRNSLQVSSEEFQEVLKSWGPGYTPVTGVFVQTSDHKLRLINDKGEMINKLQICGGGMSFYSFWWDGLGYLNCPPAELRIEAL